MDLVSTIITFATASFLIPIVNDFQRKTAGMTRKLSALEAHIQMVEKSSAEGREEEAGVSAELHEAEKEFAEVEKECRELQKAVEWKKKKRTHPTFLRDGHSEQDGGPRPHGSDR